MCNAGHDQNSADWMGVGQDTLYVPLHLQSKSRDGRDLCLKAEKAVGKQCPLEKPKAARFNWQGAWIGQTMRSLAACPRFMMKLLRACIELSLNAERMSQV